jgi:hypothetical protein
VLPNPKVRLRETRKPGRRGDRYPEEDAFQKRLLQISSIVFFIRSGNSRVVRLKR